MGPSLANDDGDQRCEGCAAGFRHRSQDYRHSRRDSKASDDKGVTMRFGHLRGVMLAVALVSSMATVRSAFADGFGYTIPREVLARDLNMGEPHHRPPYPRGPLRQGRPLRLPSTLKHCGLCGLLLGKGPRGAAADTACSARAATAAARRGCGHCGNGLFNHGSERLRRPKLRLLTKRSRMAGSEGEGLRPLRRSRLPRLRVDGVRTVGARAGRCDLSAIRSRRLAPGLLGARMQVGQWPP